MRDINKWVVGGRLTRDPKVVSGEGTDKLVVNMSLATNYSEKHKGEWQDKVMYVEFPAFGKLAENCLKYLSKGSKVVVTGKALMKEWTNQDSATKYSMTCFPDEIHFMDNKKGAAETANAEDCPF